MAGPLVPYHSRSDRELDPRSLPPAWTPPPAAPHSSIPWQRYISVLKRYKWLMLGISVAGTAAGIGATRLITPEYEVQAAIWISIPTPASRASGPIRSTELLSSPQSWPELLKSFAILDTAVRSQRLYVNPEESAHWSAFAEFSTAPSFRTGSYVLSIDDSGRQYALKTDEGEVLDSGAVGDSIGRALGFHWQPAATTLPAGEDVAFNLVTPREAAVQLRDRLMTALPRESSVFRLRLTGSDPVRTAATLNVVNREFVNTAAALKKRSQVELVKTLGTQLEYAQNELTNAEKRLETFRVEDITKPSEHGSPLTGGVQVTRDPMLSNYFNQKIEHDSVRHDREALERTLAEVRSGSLAVHAFHAIPAVSTSRELNAALIEYASLESRLRAAQLTYTDEHRTVRDLQASLARFRTEIIPQLAEGLIVQARRRENDLDTRITSAGGVLRNIPVRTIEEMRLTRNVAVRSDLYQTLKSRFEEARLAEASALPDVSVLDSAVAPRYPSSSSAPRILLMAFMGSIGFAVLLAILLDRLDRRFRYPEQVTTELGLPILGAVPNVRRPKPGKRDPEQASQVVESFRSLRLNLQHALGGARPIRLTVSSAGSGDGKSLICSNLALSLAEAGYRTLLIDGDIRRGELHATFGVPRRPGLIDHLQGDVAMEQILHTTLHERLTLIPCGTRRHRGPELLASQRMATLLSTLEPSYDAIVVDSAPLGAGADAFVLGIATGNMLLVFRSGETDRKMAEAKLEFLPRIPVRVIGAVLNDVPAEGAYRYYSYIYGYSPTDEQDRPRDASKVGELSGRA